MTDTIAALGESALVDRIQARVGTGAATVPLGIGDDAAVLTPVRGQLEVLTTDSLVEGIHFRRDWTAPRAIGHKALAVNLSDLAAMGATPRASLLSLALPGTLPVADFDALLDGYAALAEASGATLVGGNLTRSPGPVVIDVTALGDVVPRRMLRRAGAAAGDELYVTGAIGAGVTGLEILRAGVDRDGLDPDLGACLARYETPDARTRCGRVVGRSRAAVAAIDLSDGLADAARRLARAAGVGVTIDAAALPVHPGARAWAGRTGVDPVATAVAGGDDYELAFAVRPRHRNRFLAALRRCRPLTATLVGTFSDDPGEWLLRDGTREPLPAGFAHF